MGTHFLSKLQFQVLAFLLPALLMAQQSDVPTARDGFVAIVKDARAAGLGDIGVATSADAYSQFWNPSKYIFSRVDAGIAVSQILNSAETFSTFSQLNLIFFNKPNDRSAYALSVRNYAFGVNTFVESGESYRTHEVAIDGSYTLKLSDEFALSVAGRFISLNGKASQVDSFDDESTSNLYGIDVSVFYYGNEKAYKQFNGRWRAGFNMANIRGKSATDTKDIEIYAPSTLNAGLGFDFIFDQDMLLGITTEYKILLDAYTENEGGEPLWYGLTGSVMALGAEFEYREKLIARTGYSKGINRKTDSFGSLGAGFRSRYVDLDVAILIGLSDDENPIREKLRVSLGLDLAEVLFGER